MSGHLLLVDGFPGAGKTRLGGIIQKRLGARRVRVFDADDVTQELLETVDPRGCADFMTRIVEKANRDLMKRIAAVPERELVVVEGLVHLVLDEDCRAEIIRCKGCEGAGRHVHRVWLDIRPPGGRSARAELEESVKRAVLRELAQPTDAWPTPDPDSADTWDHMKPPSKPMSAKTKKLWFKRTPAKFRRAHLAYFDAMMQSFELDGIDVKWRSRVLEGGYKPMREQAIVELAESLTRDSDGATPAVKGGGPRASARTRTRVATRTLRPPPGSPFARALTLTYRPSPRGAPASSDELAIAEVHDKRAYRSPTRGFDVEPGEVWLDVGAHIGAFAFYAVLRGARKVYCVEALRENYELLCRNIDDNGLRDVVVPIHAAVVPRALARKRTVPLHLPRDERNTYRASVMERPMATRTETVPAISFAALLRRARGARAIKMDIEGAEVPILTEAAVPRRITKLVFEYTVNSKKILEIERNLRARGMALDRLQPNLRQLKRGRIDKVVFAVRRP